jgi:exopolysaccharide biosynthesis polyprenyl glycosylphosphotransferase
MLRRFGVNFVIFSMCLDAGLTLVAFQSAIYIRVNLTSLPLLVETTELPIPASLYALIPLLWLVTLLFASVYDPKRIYKIVDEIQVVTIATAVAGLLFAGLLYLAYRDFSRWLFFLFIFFDLILLISWRLIARLAWKLIPSPAKERRVLIVGAGEVGQRVGKMIGEYAWTGLHLQGYLDDDPSKSEPTISVLGKIKEAKYVVQNLNIDDVIIALPRRAYGEVNKLVYDLHALPVNLRVVPDYFSLTVYRATVDDFGGIPMVNLRDPVLSDFQRLAKRVFDLIFSSIALLFLLPIMLIIALAVRWDSKGPILFRQQRVGENGSLFGMYKFRSMVVGADKMQGYTQTDKNGQVNHKQRNDPRVTRIGQFLRRTSLDELPQLFNVLKGDMSLVGPRPELPWLLHEYKPWQQKRFAVPQGMTGWWQVNGRADKLMHLFPEDDLYYVQNYSLWLDLYILLKTPWVVLRGTGAY